MPTIRPASLQPATALARELGCLLVVLCTTQEQVSQVLRQEHGETTLVTYVPPAADSYYLNFLTSAHPDVGAALSCHADIARKRNVGLLLARICGWRTLVYLDDDIRNLTASGVARATAMLRQFPAVGFEIADFPDNSVVCHAHRLAGARQGIFPGGSALLIDISHASAFFPSVYNEDWLFLFDTVNSRSLAVAGRLTQLEYFPFAHPARAASEEFGDLLAEGLYRLLHEGGGIADATLDYWHLALDRRTQLIDDIAARLLLPNNGRALTGPALMSLAAARRRLTTITPLACVAFIHAWQSDLDTWRKRLASLPLLGDLRDAVKFLDLPIVGAEVTR